MISGGRQTPDTLDAKIRTAIADKRLIKVGYNGSARVAEPHDYGIQRGTIKLLVFQRQPEGWRLLECSKIESLEILVPPFPGSRGRDHKQHMIWDELFARVG